MSQKKSMNLGVKILIGLVLGIVVGAIFWATMGAEAAGAFTAKYITKKPAAKQAPRAFVHPFFKISQPFFMSQTPSRCGPAQRHRTRQSQRARSSCPPGALLQRKRHPD